MSKFEYAAIFYGFMIALAIEGVAANLHRLFAAGKKVRWHWMAPVTAFNAILVTLTEFWILWTQRGDWSGSYPFLGFLPFACSLIFMYLSAAASLPDEVPPEGLKLREFYFDNRAHYWGLVTGFFLFNATLTVVDQFRFGWFGPTWQKDFPLMTSDLIAIVIAGPLILVRNYWWHAAGIAVSALYLLIFAWSLQLN
jgi:hypothetical protein